MQSTHNHELSELRMQFVNKQEITRIAHEELVESIRSELSTVGNEMRKRISTLEQQLTGT